MSNQVTKPVFLYKHVRYDFEAVRLSDLSPPEIDSEYILLGKGDAVFEMTITEAEVVAASIETLKKQITGIRADAQTKVEEVEERIQSMLSITHMAEV